MTKSCPAMIRPFMNQLYKELQKYKILSSNRHHVGLKKPGTRGLESRPYERSSIFPNFQQLMTLPSSFAGSVTFETPLKPCCMGISSKYYCGSVDEKGAKMYTVCENREAAFFWDMVHPTQAGWRAVYFSLKSTLDKIN